jgi:hypothetical protein
MIEQLQLFLKDPTKVAKAATVSFFIIVIIVAWFLFTLPHDLVYQGGMIDSHRATVVYVKLFVVIALAFGACYALIFFSQRAKKETIVYLDKKIESSASQQSTAAGQSQDSLNLNALRQRIKSGNVEEKWRNGLSELCNQLSAGQGALYAVKKKGDNKSLELKSGYALVLAEGEQEPSFEWGEGLIGQVAASGKSKYLDELPEGYASRIESGLGNALPKFLYIFPIKKENESIGVIEVATFTALSEALRKQAGEAANILSEIS